jgi:hypothetical protein
LVNSIEGWTGVCEPQLFKTTHSITAGIRVPSAVFRGTANGYGFTVPSLTDVPFLS